MTTTPMLSNRGFKIVLVLASIALLLWALWLVLKPLLPTVVTVDMQGLVNEYSEQLAAHTLPPAREAQLSDAFAKTLEDVVVRYAQQHDVVILVAPAVLAGANDVTPTIRHLVIEQMMAQQANPLPEESLR
jgi:conjugal transfer pilin signal peptidase TrbI